ncbi:MAG: undecaprenyldiphospho-muramoylpentapeptide beta-N-acetylglucosaminyltransferase [Deltaproteobacteria bacterium]|jgi:UDP-N-acetylglucosamine--N-acetylmuramyl-(pentapeptide) pyrophosphoryl-undecaprenol N-acetylglucosamine transferase|nr:undecaprenyldiphospho-muramoylpentapeptide beta-N-acetylglucosaminyltransferase [Deltaproteobacteria bacterium]
MAKPKAQNRDLNKVPIIYDIPRTVKKDFKVLIAAGGTGGHVMPAATVAGELKALYPEADLLFVGAGRPAEGAILDPLGYKRKILKVPTLAGKNPLKAALALFSLFKSLVGAASIVRDYKPDICLAFGGYVCGPVGLVAKIFGLPLVLHEQNSKPGLTNRLLGRIADLAMVGFPETEEAFKARRVAYVGNPVRKEIALLGQKQKAFEQNPLGPRLLAVGGSQGSKKLNLAVMELAKTLTERQIPFRLTHQTGTQMEAEVKGRYDALKIEAEVLPFISDMARAYLEADLAITRAGALTLAELAAAKVPCVLVPLPTAAGDHQSVNARSLEKMGLARVAPEKDLDSGLLEKIVLPLIQNPEKLRAMSESVSLEAGDLASVGPKMAKLVLETLRTYLESEAAKSRDLASKPDKKD